LAKIFKDINLSLENNIYNDFSILQNRNSIINTFKNNLMIGPEERYFDNREQISIKNLLHKSFNDAVIEEYLDELIQWAARQDTRIDEILNVHYLTADNSTNNEYTLEIIIQMSTNVVINERGDNILDFKIFVKDIR
jgi:hypothetical protein